MKFIALSFLLVIPPTYADRGGNASWTQHASSISTRATEQASEKVMTTAAKFPSASIIPSPSVSVVDSIQKSQIENIKLHETTVLNVQYSSSVKQSSIPRGASSKAYSFVGSTLSNFAILPNVTSSVAVEMSISSSLIYSSTSYSLFSSVSSLLEHSPKVQNGTFNSTFIKVSSHLTLSEGANSLASTPATIPNTSISTHLIQSTQSNQRNVTKSIIPSFLVHRQNSSQTTIELSRSMASFSFKSTYTKLFQSSYSKEPSGETLRTSKVIVTSHSPSENISIISLPTSEKQSVTTTEELHGSPTTSVKSTSESVKSLNTSVDKHKITNSVASTKTSLQPLEPKPLLTARPLPYLYHTAITDGGSTAISAVFALRVTASFVQEHSVFSTSSVQTTRVVTIRTSKDRGLPPWAVITVAVGAFLFVCLIAIVAFKIVQWNKDHGDYKLWSTDLELTPITSRTEKDSLIEPPEYEQPLLSFDGEVRIYSQGRCISVRSPEQCNGSAVVESAVPLLGKAIHIKNNNVERLVDYSRTSPVYGPFLMDDLLGLESAETTSSNNAEMVATGIKRSVSEDLSSCESANESPNDQDPSPEPNYSSIDELGLVRFNPNDLLFDRLDALKVLPPQPPSPHIHPREGFLKRGRAVSLDNETDAYPMQDRYPRRMFSKSNPDFEQMCPKDRGHFKILSKCIKNPLFSCHGRSLAGQCIIPTRASKNTCAGEQRIQVALQDLGSFMSSNSQEQLDDIDFSSNRLARSLPKPRPCKRVETRHSPANIKRKKYLTQSQECPKSAKVERDVNSSSTTTDDPILQLEANPYATEKSEPSTMTNAFDCASQTFMGRRRKGSKDLVAVEIGLGRPRLLLENKNPNNMSTVASSSPRGRSTSTPVSASEYVRECSKERDNRVPTNGMTGRKAIAPPLEGGHPKRKFSSPINMHLIHADRGWRPRSRRGSVDTQLSVVKRDRKVVEPPLHSLSYLTESVEQKLDETGAQVSEACDPEPDPMTPYAEVRLSTVLAYQDLHVETDRLQRPQNLTLPYLMTDLVDTEYSSIDNESPGHGGGYLKLVPCSQNEGMESEKRSPDPFYWYPTLHSTCDQPFIDTKEASVFSFPHRKEDILSPSTPRTSHVYTEIGSLQFPYEASTYEHAQTGNERLSIMSIPEPGYEAVRRRKSLLFESARNSVDSAIFSSSEDTLRVSEDLTLNEKISDQDFDLHDI